MTMIPFCHRFSTKPGLFALLVVECILAMIPAVLAQQCFSHDECADTAHFCSWTKCQDENGSPYPCGRCLPCEECICDDNSTDFRCPMTCPSQPSNGVRFIQGAFYNHSTLQVEDHHCVRRLVVMGNMFSLVQLPVYSLHPATTATINQTDVLFTCPSYVRLGVLRSTLEILSSGMRMYALLLSEGDSPSAVRAFANPT
jgi:hypothetical protein